MSDISQNVIPESRREFYTAVREISSGAYGVVYEIEVIKDFSNGTYNFHKGMKLAMKKLKNEHQQHDFDMDIPEVDILNRINHVNVINAYETIKDIQNGNCYGYITIMPLALYSLNDLIESTENKYTQSDILDISYQILCGLDYLHINHIIHDDIKPDNILIFEDDNNRIIPKIGDFGLSATVFGPCNIIKNGGAFFWRPAESLVEYDYYISSNKNDIWAMGLTLLELITKKLMNDFVIVTYTGKTPTQKEGIKMLIKEFLDRGNWKDDPSFNGELSGLIDVIGGMLNPDSKQRISASEALKYPVFDGIRRSAHLMESFTWDIKYPDMAEFPKIMKHRRKELERMNRNNHLNRIVSYSGYNSNMHDISWNVLFLAYDIFDRYVSKLYQLGTLTEYYNYGKISFAAMYLSYNLFYISVKSKELRTESGFYSSKKKARNMICDVMEKLDWKLSRPTLYQQYPEINPIRLFKCYLTKVDPTLDCLREIDVCT